MSGGGIGCPSCRSWFRPTTRSARSFHASSGWWRVVLREKRFGFEPEIVAQVARMRLRIVEMPISYSARTYDEGKKIGVREGGGLHDRAGLQLSRSEAPHLLGSPSCCPHFRGYGRRMPGLRKCGKEGRAPGRMMRAQSTPTEDLVPSHSRPSWHCRTWNLTLGSCHERTDRAAR